MRIYNESYTYSIATKRLFLEPFSKERDLQAYQMHLSDGEECLRLFGVPYSTEIADHAPWHCDGDCTYTVFLRGTDTIIGSISLHPAYDTAEATWNLSFWIFDDYRRFGYAKEATHALLTGFLWGSLMPKKQSKVFAKTTKENGAAVRLLRSLGFCKTGMFLQYITEGNNIYLMEAESYALLSSLFIKQLQERLAV